MESKNISIRIDLYEKLKNLKKQDESFSDVIERLLYKGLKGNSYRLMKHFGAWSDLPEEFDTILKQFRNTFNTNMDSRLKERMDDISR
jgi:predicted CopG family antitoxin